MGNCYCCCYCKTSLEKEKENEINDFSHIDNDTKITNTSNRIELFITDGVKNFNWTFNNYQNISEIVDRIKKETNKTDFELIANGGVLSMNKIKNELKNGDMVFIGEKLKGGKYFN